MHPSGIRTRNPSKPEATDSRFRPCRHWDKDYSVENNKLNYTSIKLDNSSVPCEYSKMDDMDIR